LRKTAKGGTLQIPATYTGLKPANHLKHKACGLFYVDKCGKYTEIYRESLAEIPQSVFNNADLRVFCGKYTEKACAEYKRGAELRKHPGIKGKNA